MSTLQDYDGLLLSFNNKFLTNLIGESYSLSKIRFKFISVQRNPMYRTFPSYDEFYKYFQSVLVDPQRSCLSGRFAIIESIDITNDSLKFPNVYHIRNVTKGLNIQLDYKLDNYRNSFNESQVKTYQKYLNRKFVNYITDISTLTTIRKQNYIESCWIDPDYFVGETIQLLTV